MATRLTPSIDAIRAQFPALAQDVVFMDNAGGSQVPACVADGVRDYMLTSYVQLGADYPLSQQATRVVEDAHGFIETLMGVGGTGSVILGASSSGLCRMLADCYAEVLQPGDEIVVAMSGHEANIGPWVRLSKFGATIRPWEPDSETGHSNPEALAGLLNDRTRLVAMPHVSNLLGAIEEVEACIEMAHRVGARVIVDGVAYAPHGAMDVAALGADFYVYSCYKVFGPHMGALFGTHEALAELTGPNHFFFPKESVPGKFELGGVSHEGCAGLLSLRGYLGFLAGRPAGAQFDRSVVVDAFGVIRELEAALSDRLLAFLRAAPGVRIIGPAEAGPNRVPTISFVHERVPAGVISREAAKAGIGIRAGHGYAYRLVERLGIDTAVGVARVSLAHYNTAEEVERLILFLQTLS